MGCVCVRPLAVRIVAGSIISAVTLNAQCVYCVLGVLLVVLRVTATNAYTNTQLHMTMRGTQYSAQQPQHTPMTIHNALYTTRTTLYAMRVTQNDIHHTIIHNAQCSTHHTHHTVYTIRTQGAHRNRRHTRSFRHCASLPFPITHSQNTSLGGTRRFNSNLNRCYSFTIALFERDAFGKHMSDGLNALVIRLAR